MSRPVLTLAHSPDPDDAFMWWPITGKVRPGLDGDIREVIAPPVLDTGRFQYRAVPADIEVLNRHAAGGAPPFDITALSFRAYCDVKDAYAITSCGSSFGDGFGPKVVARSVMHARVGVGANAARDVDWLRAPGTRIAIPGRRTTAFLVLGMILGREVVADAARFVEMPFERIIPAVASGEVDAGLVIHEGQVLYEQAGLKLIADVGAWWKERTGLPLPLGANAVRRDLDTRFGPGTMREVTRTLRASIDHALAHRREALEYTMPFALANTTRSGAAAGEPPTLERVDRYVAMYVNKWTVDMGDNGRDAVVRLLREGAALGLCPDPGNVDVVTPD